MTTKAKTKASKAKATHKRAQAFADRTGVYIPDMGIEPHVKPGFTPPNASETEVWPAPGTKAPGGAATYSDVVEALHLVRNVCGKDQALTLLRSAGAMSVRNLEPRCYDALVVSCEQVVALMLHTRRGGRGVPDATAASQADAPDALRAAFRVAGA